MTDPYVGKLTFFRVYSGVAQAGSYVYNSRPRTTSERIGRILQMHANKREEIDEVYAGDIAAVIGLKDTRTGDTLCDADHPIVLEAMHFPEPVIDVAIEPKTKADQDKLAERAAEALPTRTRRSGCTPTRRPARRSSPGMGELHLEIIVDRMLREFNVEANVGKPQVAYRETIRRRSRSRQVHAPDRRPRPVRPRVDHRRAAEPGGGFVFENKIVGGAIPREYIPAGREGHPRGDGERRPGRLPDGRRQGRR